MNADTYIASLPQFRPLSLKECPSIDPHKESQMAETSPQTLPGWHPTRDVIARGKAEAAAQLVASLRDEISALHDQISTLELDLMEAKRLREEIERADFELIQVNETFGKYGSLVIWRQAHVEAGKIETSYVVKIMGHEPVEWMDLGAIVEALNSSDHRAIFREELPPMMGGQQL